MQRLTAGRATDAFDAALTNGTWDAAVDFALFDGPQAERFSRVLRFSRDLRMGRRCRWAGALPPERMRALEVALQDFGRTHEGWVALAHGTEPTLDALRVRIGIRVATCGVSEMAAALAERGMREGDLDDLISFEASEFDDVALRAAKMRFSAARDAAMTLLPRHNTRRNSCWPSTWPCSRRTAQSP